MVCYGATAKVDFTVVAMISTFILNKSDLNLNELPASPYDFMFTTLGSSVISQCEHQLKQKYVIRSKMNCTAII